MRPGACELAARGPSANPAPVAARAAANVRRFIVVMIKGRFPKGTVKRLVVDSRVLRDNLLGDLPERVVDVYVPAGAGLPLLTDLVGFTAGGPVHTNWSSFRENVPERLDRLIAEDRMAPVVVAFPDCFTRLGGNQYINSAAMGRWSDFLIDE